MPDISDNLAEYTGIRSRNFHKYKYASLLERHWSSRGIEVYLYQGRSKGQKSICPI